MRLTFVLLVVIFFVPQLVLCDFESARNAANRGDFNSARIEWEQLDAEGNKDATFSLGRMYARGDGVKRDFNRAFEYFSKAANLGHQRALLSLGTMYFYGDGVAKDPSLAKYYLNRAEAAGLKEATPLLKSLKDVVEANPKITPVEPSASTAVLVDAKPCEIKNTAAPVWAGGLSPGDSFGNVYCKLSKLSSVSKVRGTSQAALLTPPIPGTSDRLAAAAVMFGGVKVLADSSVVDPKIPPRILVSDPLVKVDSIEFANMRFSAVLWFKQIESVQTYEQIPSSGGDLALVSQLYKLTLQSEAVKTTEQFARLVEQLKSEHPQAQVSELTDPLDSPQSTQIKKVKFALNQYSITITNMGKRIGIRYES